MKKRQSSNITEDKKKDDSKIEPYAPSDSEKEIILDTYKMVEELVEAQNKTYPEFNDRTLKQFIDDGDKRLNAYVTPKDSYDPPKEAWQANVPLPTIRNKTKKILAGFSLLVPDMRAVAFGEDQLIDVHRGDIAMWLIKGSYQQEENSVVENFWEAWENFRAGTVIKYEGYLKTRYKQKFITSYDITTGEIEFDEKEVDVDDKCISYLMPIMEFLPRDFTIHNVQDQPDCAWVRYLDKDIFEYEFGQYKNSDKVKTRSAWGQADPETVYNQEKWSSRAGKEKIEVVRYYNKYKDVYRIIANGVLLLDAPLLWKINGLKVYPFAKTILEPFVTKNFFYGNSFANIMAGQYDLYNTTFNTLSDKQFRSMVKPLIVGRANSDAFDLEDEWLTSTTKITVEDVNQIKEMDIEGINNSDVVFLKLLAQGIDDTAPSLPDLMGNKQATAREIVIAEEKLREMKVLYNEMQVDLWRQKCALRLANIQLNYPQPRKSVEKTKSGKMKEVTIYRTFVIENAELDKATGESGYLAIQFKKVADKDKKKMKDDIAVEEAMMKQQGINYKKLILPPDFLDNHRIQIEIIPESIMRTSEALLQSKFQEEMVTIAKLFPQIFVMNQKEYFTEFSRAYGKNPAKYLSKLDQLMAKANEEQASGGQEPGQEGAPGPEQGGNGSEAANNAPAPVPAAAPAA
jgi:hypothetical protein